MIFSRRVFYGSGIYGILVLLPMLFLEEKLGIAFPPATNRPEQYYAFVGVALAWQFVFLLIAGDVNRYRPLMILAVVQKLLVAGTAIWLVALCRIDVSTLAPFLVDLSLGFLFIACYVRSSELSSSLTVRS
jgi:hypothetical protein